MHGELHTSDSASGPFGTFVGQTCQMDHFRGDFGSCFGLFGTMEGSVQMGTDSVDDLVVWRRRVSDKDIAGGSKGEGKAGEPRVVTRRKAPN